MKLIIINGSVGVGKSTLAQRLHREFPLSFLLDIDEQRRFISEYRERPKDSKFLSFEVALAIADTCLRSGRDVIVDKMMYGVVEPGRTANVLDLLIGLGEKYHADVHEFILTADKRTAMQRLTSRGFRPGGLLTMEKAERFWKEMDAYKDQRRNATVIDTSSRSAEEVFDEVRKSL